MAATRINKHEVYSSPGRYDYLPNFRTISVPTGFCACVQTLDTLDETRNYKMLSITKLNRDEKTIIERESVSLNGEVPVNRTFLKKQ